MAKLKIINKYLQKLGFEVYRYSPRINHIYRRAKLMKHLKIDTVLDVGANNGSYGLEIREAGFKGKIISFEPINSAYTELHKKSRIDSKWDVYNIALGDINSNLSINISENVFSSSFLEIEKKHLDASLNSKYIGIENCEVKTLNSLFDQLNLKGKKIYLKIDTQGYEDKVLNGANDVLENIIAIQVELSMQPLYKGQCLFHELYILLLQKGFSLNDVSPGFLSETTGEMLQFDGIFRRFE